MVFNLGETFHVGIVKTKVCSIVNLRSGIHGCYSGGLTKNLFGEMTEFKGEPIKLFVDKKLAIQLMNIFLFH